MFVSWQKIGVYDGIAIAVLVLKSKIKSKMDRPGAMWNIIEISNIDVIEAFVFVWKRY